jgi:hypothetical protein
MLSGILVSEAETVGVSLGVLLRDTVSVMVGVGNTVSVLVGSENQLFKSGIFNVQAEMIKGTATNIAKKCDILYLLTSDTLYCPEFCMVILKMLV